MEGNQYLHITISKHNIIENSLGVAIYGHTYNIMHIILVGNIYHTILDEGPFYMPFLVQDTCMPPSPSYILLYLHTYVWFSSTPAHTVSGTCNRVLQAHVRHIGWHICLKKCHLMLHWTLLKKYKCHWLLMLKHRG